MATSLYCEYHCLYLMDRYNGIFAKGYGAMIHLLNSSDYNDRPYYLFYILVKLPINKKAYIIRNGYNDFKYQIDIKNIQDYYKYFMFLQIILQYDESSEGLDESINLSMEVLNPLIMEITEDKYNEVIEYYNNTVK